MRQTMLLSTLLLAFAVAFTAAPAWGQSPHFTSGPATTQTSSSITETECATISGLGNTLTTVTLTCSADVQCQNKAGHPDESTSTVTSSTNYQPHSGTIKNACATVTATCSAGGQTAISANFTNCTYQVFQNGQLVLSSP